MKSIRGFAPILIVFIVLGSVIVGAGSMFAYQKYQNNKGAAAFKEDAPTASNLPIENDNSSPSPKSDETASWKTYKFEEITFKHPPGWEIGSNGICGPGIHLYPITTRTNELTDAQKLCPPNDAIFIYSDQNPENLTVDQFFIRSGILTTSNKATPITVAGIKSMQYSDIPGSVPAQVIFIPFHNKIFTINWVQGNELISRILFNQILSTFQFIN